MSETTPSRATQPIRKWRVLGGLSAAVWEHVNENGGQPYKSYSIRLNKRVRNRDTNQWEDMPYLRVEDLPAAQWALAQAYDFLLSRTSGQQDDVEFP